MSRIAAASRLVLLIAAALTSSPAAAAPVFSAAQGMAEGCADLGWAPRRVERGDPARVELSNGNSWLIGCTGFAGPFASLRLRVKSDQPPEHVEVQLDQDGPALPRVALSRGTVEPQPDGWLQVAIPVAVLAPAGARFQRLLFHAAHDSEATVLLDEIELIPGAAGAAHPAAKGPEKSAVGPSRKRKLAIRCDRPGHPISPLIYGVAYMPGDEKKAGHTWDLHPAAIRWGGNPTTRYNWELGNAWNTARDWFFRNVNYTGQPGPAWKRFLEANAAHGARSAVTLPTIGWVAKDLSSYSFPVSELGPQRGVAPELHDAGNGERPDGTLIDPPPPLRTSVAASPAFIGRWVRAIRAQAKTDEPRLYILDNEPNLWSSTHRDVHPEPLGYDELLERSIAYASAVRAEDPKAIIAGPAEWGWLNYFYSAKDMTSAARTDRLAHGGTALLPWWLGKMRTAGKALKTRLLDVVDVHFYPQSNVGIATGGGTDPETAARRIRSTRALWDPTYKDESWIDEPIMLLPRLQKWIAQSYPGLGISIGEWNFGAEGHISGGLATAEALGRFGVQGIDSAYYWIVPANRSAAYWAFRAYRDYDGKGARFLDTAVPTEGGDQSVSLFASRDARRVVAIMLNLDPSLALDAQLDASSCGALSSARSFVYTGGEAGFTAGAAPSFPGGAAQAVAPAWSITVLELQLKAEH